MNQLEMMCDALKRRQLRGPLACAKGTLEIIRLLIGKGKFNSADEMMTFTKLVGHELTRSAPFELVIGNIVKRVIHMMKEEATSVKNGDRSSDNEESVDDSNGDDSDGAVPCKAHSGGNGGIDSPTSYSSNSLSSILGFQRFSSTNLESMDDEDSGVNQDALFPQIRNHIMSSINEFHDEIHSVNSQLCEQCQEHLHADECILVYGYNQALEYFFKAAARKRKFQVIICEGAPHLEGIQLATALGTIENIDVCLIPDSGIYAIMSRVNKVFICPEAVMADGGAISSAGTLMLASVAKEHHVSVVGLAPTFYLTPLFAHNQTECLGQLLSPALCVPYNLDCHQENVELANSAFDYIPPELMDLYVTNSGSHQPGYIYRLLSEFYDDSKRS